MLSRLLTIVSCFFFFTAASAQEKPVDTTHARELVISYSIQVNTHQKKPGLADTYDGGSKTFFIGRNRARIRLVSLMRIESIFFLPKADSTTGVYQVKESGRKPNRRLLNEEEWTLFNNKYDSARYTPVAGETKTILDITCKKAIIYLQDGRTVSCYYSDRYPALPALYDPLFSRLPGLVLEYTYTYKSGTTTFTANSLKYDTISPGIFLLNGTHPAELKL